MVCINLVMTTWTNSEGKDLSYTKGLLQTIILQLNGSNTYYTTGEHDVIFIKLGSNKVSLLDFTYHVNRHTFQNYTINEHTINNYNW